jgi:ABC-type nitrate/sulfonate/bicarbonate transport system permease component
MDHLSSNAVRSARPAILGFAGVLFFLVIWQIIPAIGLIDPTYFPNATDTLTQLFKDLGTASLWKDIADTLIAWGLGLAIATVLAVTFGTIIGLVPFLRRATHTTVEFLRPIPSVALIPLAILLYGLRLQAALLIIVYASFWQVFVQALYGVADVDSVARDTARSFGLTRSQRFRSLVFPTALPYLITGIRLAAAVALILTITAQMFIGTPGIGRSIIFAQQGANWVQVYALVVVTGVLGLLVNIVFRAIERRVLRWHESVRGEELL